MLLNPYPHAGGCNGCRLASVCNTCGTAIRKATRCTNGRCLDCHRQHCGNGGDIAPGHGFGTVGATVAHDDDRKTQGGGR
jgi:hypothetical protein